MSDKPLPWNWKVQVENFTDAYHPEYVHIGTHDFAPSVMEGDGVRFTEMKPGDNAIVRSVPMRTSDGGMMSDGWGPEAAFPAIATLPAEQRRRITFAMLPPSLTLMFAPGTVAYTLIRPTGVTATFAGSDRVTYGGWLLPQSTMELPDFMDRCKAVSQGGSKIWAQDVPVNLGMQAAKTSRFLPDGIYGPLETTLQQFNVWLLEIPRGDGGSARRDGCTWPSGRGASGYCRRIDRGAFVDRDRDSACGSGSPRADCAGFGQVARQDDALALRLDVGIGHRHRRHQRLGVGMGRRGVDLVLAGHLDDLAEIHHGDVVADVPHDAEIVGDEDVGEAELAAAGPAAG